MIDPLKLVDAVPGYAARREWPTVRLWRVARIRLEKNRPDLSLLSVFLGRGVIAYGEGGGQVHKPGLDLSVYQVVRKGNFVLNNQQAWRGSVGVSKYDGIISPAYVVFELSHTLNPRFADYLFRSRVMVDQFVTSSKGVGDIQRDIHISWLKNTKLPLPPIEEQTAIVRFLDNANEHLGRFIRDKQKLIKLLEEQKKAIIHLAVTRGLDSNIHLKPSTIPWLGEYPAHWNRIPIKRLLCRLDYGTSEVSTENGSVRVLTMGNIQKGEVIVPRSGGLDEVPDSLLLEYHDLLFTRTNGNPDLVGKVGIFRGQIADKVSFASYLVRLRVKRPHEPQWLHMLLNSTAFWPFARSHALVNLQTNLNSTRYGQFPVPVPPPAEQLRIIEWVVEKSKPMNTAISRIEREIDLLREYRTRLIADVVTGKHEVRGIELPALAEGEIVEDLVDVEETETDEDVELVAETTNAEN